MVCDGYNRVINQDELAQMRGSIYFHCDYRIILLEGECYKTTNFKNKYYFNMHKWGGNKFQKSGPAQEDIESI